jgi:hypothetical protein
VGFGSHEVRRGLVAAIPILIMAGNIAALVEQAQCRDKRNPAAM